MAKEKKITVSIALTPTELARIDKARGDVPRSVWIRIVCRKALERANGK